MKENTGELMTIVEAIRNIDDSLIGEWYDDDEPQIHVDIDGATHRQLHAIESYIEALDDWYLDMREQHRKIWKIRRE